MAVKVCKFGGTSMADGNVMKNVKKIIEGDPDRRFIVVSAPGRRYGDDVKVTDLMLSCYDAVCREGRCASEFARVRSRFEGIARELNIGLDVSDVMDEVERDIDAEADVDFTASRGEYVCARIMSRLLGARFIDAKDVVFFGDDGRLDEGKTYKAIRAATANVGMAVIPGFYGSGADGRIVTFSRGGSDISGALVARAVGASLYENWTDVSGFYACDPRIVNNPRRIRYLSYRELRELSYMGADVMHPDSIFPVRQANIPILIKNTFRPDDEGTYIIPTAHYRPNGEIVTGIAGHKNFTEIFIEKQNMNSEIGFVRKVMSVLEELGISVEHIPSGIDTMSLVMESSQLGEIRLEQVIDGIRDAVSPDVIRVIEDIALVATVGHGLGSSLDTPGRLFRALADAGVGVKLIDQGSSGLNIIVGVKGEDYEKCISAIYHEFF